MEFKEIIFPSYEKFDGWAEAIIMSYSFLIRRDEDDDELEVSCCFTDSYYMARRNYMPNNQDGYEAACKWLNEMKFDIANRFLAECEAEGY